VLALGTDHLSCYGLTYEANTAMTVRMERGEFEPCDDALEASMLERAAAILRDDGFAHYEVSNWARPGHECRHNLLYWHQCDYQGFGCAAHSHIAGRRFWNVRTPDRYIDLVSADASVESAGEELDAAARRIEGLQLQLRLREGVPFEALDGDALPGVVELRDNRWVLTQRGRLMANDVSLRLKD
jgi:oxygen-independent coproporphyrinogen-3 oxidase